MDAFEEGEGGHVRQVHPDERYLHNQQLWKAHRACVARARNKASARKAESMRMLALPGGRHMAFSKASRADIDPALIRRIM